MLTIVPTRTPPRPHLLCCHEASTQTSLPSEGRRCRSWQRALGSSASLGPVCPGRLDGSVLWECSPGLQVGPESPPFADCYVYLPHPFRVCGWPLGLHSVSSLVTARARVPCLPLLEACLMEGSAPTLEPPGAESVPLSACTCLTSPKCPMHRES